MGGEREERGWMAAQRGLDGYSIAALLATLFVGVVDIAWEFEQGSNVLLFVVWLLVLC